MTPLGQADLFRLNGMLDKIRIASLDLQNWLRGTPHFTCPPYQFPKDPSLANVLKALEEAISWHEDSPERMPYGLYPFMSDTVFWILFAGLKEQELLDVIRKLLKLRYVALDRWGTSQEIF